MRPNTLIGAILAGGRGTRMVPFSEHYPKPLLPVANKPLIQFQIEIMREVGITDILLVIGHKGYEIAREFGDGSDLGVRIRYVEQTQMLGIAHAVGRLEPFTDRPVLLFLGDIFFVPGDLKVMFQMFEEQQGGAVLAAKVESDPKAISKNFAMILDDRGFVRRVIEKPRHATNNLKGVGLYLFDQTIFDAIRRTPRTAMRDEYEITESIQVMIDDGLPVRVANCIQEDINVTNPADLLRCNVLEAQRAPGGRIVGVGTKLPSGSVVESSVIGGNVVVQNPIGIRRSVIFPNTHVAASADLEGVIVFPEGIVDCRHSGVDVRGLT